MKTKHNLPSEVFYCKKCVMSNQRPATHPEFSKKPLKIHLYHHLMMMVYAMHAVIMKLKLQLTGTKELRSLRKYVNVIVKKMAVMMF